MAESITVKLSGPLFAADASAKAKEAGAGVVRELTEIAMQWLAQDVPVVTGNLRRNIHPTIDGPMARITSEAIYGAWIEGTSSRNETTRFKGYANFRRAQQMLTDEQVPRVCEKWASKLAGELNGV